MRKTDDKDIGARFDSAIRIAIALLAITLLAATIKTMPWPIVAGPDDDTRFQPSVVSTARADAAAPGGTLLEALSSVDEPRSAVSSAGITQRIWQATLALVFSDWLQLLIGCLALSLLVRALRVTGRTLERTQIALDEMREATLRTSEESVAAAREREMAHVLASVKLKLAGPAKRKAVLVHVSLDNVGRTPARDVEVTIFTARGVPPSGEDEPEEHAIGFLCRNLDAGDLAAGASLQIGSVAVRVEETLPPHAADDPSHMVVVQLSYYSVFDRQRLHRIDEERIVTLVSERRGRGSALSTLPMDIEVADNLYVRPTTVESEFDVDAALSRHYEKEARRQEQNTRPSEEVPGAVELDIG